MRRRSIWALCISVSGLACSAGASGGDFIQNMQTDFWRNNCWPQPFQSADRELARSPLITMVAAGWRMHNTLSDHFFVADDQSINQAGELKLRWIVTQAPSHRRTVYVLRGASPEATTARVASVHKMIDRIASEGPRPDVLLTSVIPPGASGDYFDQVDRQLKQSIPAPRLPAMESTSGEN